MGKGLPELGEVRRGREIGKNSSSSRAATQFVWHACQRCGKERWVELKKGEPVSRFCCPCVSRREEVREAKRIKMSGENNPHWKGGRQTNSGYLMVRVYPDDPFYPMATAEGYVMEHRLVMAEHIGRCLLPSPTEEVHHKDGDRLNNELANLELTSKGAHTRAHGEGYKDGFRKGYADGVRQAIFNERGDMSSVPARDSERPQLEKQGGDLFQWAKDEDNLKKLSE